MLPDFISLPLEHVYDQLPILDLQNRMGSTGYLDFVRVEDMSHSIMKGTDAYGRPFVSLKIKEATEGETEHKCVGTFFQRYSDDEKSWAYGTCYSSGNLLYNDSRIRPDAYEKVQYILSNLSQGKTITGFNRHYEDESETYITLV